MSEPVHIAAIDAGSNAVRLSVVRAHSAIDLEPLHDERYPLRLGESVFVRHRFSEEILKKGIKAFKHFNEVMEEFGVTRYRAVATSASREAKNGPAFVRRVRQKSKIRLEIISTHEESRLGREALDRGEKLDIMEAYQRALVSTLERRGRTKNDLAALWAMLLLGSEAVKKISRETDSYTLGPQSAAALENLPEP